MAGGGRESAPNLAWGGSYGAGSAITSDGGRTESAALRYEGAISVRDTEGGATRPHCPPRALCAWAGEMSTGVQRCRESKRPVVWASHRRWRPSPRP